MNDLELVQAPSFFFENFVVLRLQVSDLLFKLLELEFEVILILLILLEEVVDFLLLLGFSFLEESRFI